MHGEYICEKYKEPNVLLKDLSDELGISSYVVGKVLDMNKVAHKDVNTLAKEVNWRGRIKQRTYSIDADYFKKWTSNMAYMLGFIYADGYLINNDLRINLQRRDKYLLEAFANELKTDRKIVDYLARIKAREYESSYLAITCLDIANDLRNLGIFQNKSLSIEYPVLPSEFEIDFIKGFFDGDGSIEVKRQIHNVKNSDTYQLRSRFSSGSRLFLEGLMVALCKYGFKKKNILSSSGRTAMTLTYSTTESIKLYDLFYKSEDLICLKRKKEKFENGMKLRDEMKGETLIVI